MISELDVEINKSPIQLAPSASPAFVHVAALIF